MNKEKILRILKNFKAGKINFEEAVEEISSLSIRQLDELTVDGSRLSRKGIPETVFCKDKKPEQVKKAFIVSSEVNDNVLGTKAGKSHFKAVKEQFSEAEFFETPGVIRLIRKPPELFGKLLIVTAGSSDMPTAEEAKLSAEFLGSKVKLITDVGVAGIHRLQKVVEELKGTRAIIVCAGMEGALPSIIAGLSPVPVIGVPTSVGYGTSFGGVSALLSMLNSCAEGLSAVNIDNGFGAACIAHMINKIGEKAD